MLGAMPESGSDTIHTTTIGNGPRKVVFMHGLMGRGRNFATSAKYLSETTTSLLVDMPNHGASAWTEKFSYIAMADEIAHKLTAGFAAEEPVVLMGHSMGGKVAMTLLQRHPEIAKAAIIEDISPGHTGSTSEFEHLIGSMLSLDLDNITSRAEADAALGQKVHNKTVRGFLLQNLRREGGKFYWEANLQLLYNSLGKVADFPEFSGTYDQPVLWIKGANSDYITAKDEPIMKRLFPKTRKVTIKDAGHWVHSEKASAFNRILGTFLERIYNND